MLRNTYLTREGYESLRKELEYLKNIRRREISQQIAEARAHGDLSENAEYDAAKEAMALLQTKVNQLESKLSRARILEKEEIATDKVSLGSTVHLRDLSRNRELQYMLVSEEEADFAQRKISVSAPVGQGLLGCKPGEVVDIKVPAGILKYQIVKISR